VSANGKVYLQPQMEVSYIVPRMEIQGSPFIAKIRVVGTIYGPYLQHIRHWINGQIDMTQ